MKTILFKSFALTLFIAMFTTNTSAHWTTKGPYGGAVSSFAVSDTLVFVGTKNGGVYRTTNAQMLSWRYANYTGMTTGGILSMAYLGTKVFAGTDNGLLGSTDIGATWSNTGTGITNTYISALVVAGTRIYAGTSGGGVFMSADTGTTWVPVNTGITNMNITCLASNGSTVYAGTSGGGVFVTTNNGGNWNSMNTGLSTSAVHALAVGGNNIFAASASGIEVSDISTINWSVVNTGLSNTSVYTLYVSGTTVYAGTADGVNTSPVAAISWAPVNTGYNGDVYAIISLGSTLVAGTAEDGIYKSPVASPTWTNMNNGFNNLEGHAIYNDGNLVIVATNKGVFVSTDLAANYYASNNGLTDSLNVTCFAFAGSKLFAGTKSGGVFMSADTGSTWIAVNTGLGSMNIRGIVSTATQIVCAAGNGSVYYSPLVSVMWTAGTGISGTPSFTSIASDGGNVLVGSQTGIYFSSNGVTYSAMNTGLTNTTINDVLFQGSNLYAATNGGGIFKAQLGTFVWSTVNTGIPSMNVYSLAKAGVYMAAGFQGSVYATNDNGANWFPTNVMDYLPEYANIHCISWSTNSTRIFVATPFNGFYSNGVAELPAEIDELKTNLSFSMYPNPSNGFVQFDISSISQEVNAVHVFDVTGKMVHSFNPPKAAMQFATQLHIFPGTYMVQLQTAAGAVMQKLIVE